MRRVCIIVLTALLFYVEARPAFSELPEICRNDWDIGVFDILKMDDKELLNLFCDTNEKLAYNQNRYREALQKGVAWREKLLKEQMDNCSYLFNKLSAAIEIRVNKGVYNKYKKSELKCLERR